MFCHWTTTSEKKVIYCIVCSSTKYSHTPPWRVIPKFLRGKGSLVKANIQLDFSEVWGSVGGEGRRVRLDVLVFSQTTNIKNYSAQPGFHNYIFHTLSEPVLFWKVIIKCSNKLFIDIYKIKFHFRYLFMKKNTYLEWCFFAGPALFINS